MAKFLCKAHCNTEDKDYSREVEADNRVEALKIYYIDMQYGGKDLITREEQNFIDVLKTYEDVVEDGIMSELILSCEEIV